MAAGSAEWQDCRREHNVVALRAIEAGEELTIDYQMTLWFTPE